MSENSQVRSPITTLPLFQDIAKRNAMAMMQYSPQELETILNINARLAAENYVRYHNFFMEDNKLLPALLAYTGVVFKHISPDCFSYDDWIYAGEHLFISSFLYGLLRPTDLISCYRLEGNVPIEGKTMFDFWKLHLTDYFIELIRSNGGLLFNLASAEMKNLFDWKKVCSSVRVVTPEFYISKRGKLKTIVIYAKMCRGEMTKFIIKNRIESADDLKLFRWEGFNFDPDRSSDDNFVFVL